MNTSVSTDSSTTESQPLPSSITLEDIECMAQDLHAAMSASSQPLSSEEIASVLKSSLSAGLEEVTPLRSQLLIYFEADEGDEPLTQVAFLNLKTLIQQRGWEIESIEAVNGYALLLFTHEGLGLQQASLETFRDEIMIRIEAEHQIYEAFEPGGSVFWVETSADKKLLVDFIYHDNNQTCTGNVLSSYWKAAMDANLSEEHAFLMLPGDIEIDSSYDKDDITVTSVMTHQEHYQG